MTRKKEKRKINKLG